MAKNYKKIARLAASYEWCTGMDIFRLTMDIVDVMIVVPRETANHHRKKTCQRQVSSHLPDSRSVQHVHKIGVGDLKKLALHRQKFVLGKSKISAHLRVLTIQ